TSWYCCVYCEGDTNDWCVSTSPMGWIKNIRVGGKDSLTVVGPAYLNREMSERLKILLNDYYGRGEATHYYWEEILKENFNDFQMKANVQTGYVYEFNHLDQVRHYDESHYDDLKREIIAHFPSAAPLLVEDIESIELLEDEWDSEMYRFDVREDAYVIRIPGEEEVSLYDHASVKHVYDILAPLEVAEELLDSDVSSGIRITRFADQSYYVDPMNDRDLSDSMQLIRQIHDRKLRIDRHYDIVKMFSHYESLVEQTGGVPFRDIEEMKQKMERLLFLKAHLDVDPVLCHGDYLYANVIRKKTGGLFITNWEFSGMSDPLMDVAMFAIDANFNEERLLLALRLYLGRDPDETEIVRLYLYAALGGMLWSMWGLHKKRHGLDLGDYPVRMYRFMKDYYILLDGRGVLSDIYE
ncbi:MAG: phosphotransferase, partial [Clostridiales bacterium]|nr:phosphotransferase [Clostridiales bacterium]